MHHAKLVLFSSSRGGVSGHIRVMEPRGRRLRPRPHHRSTLFELAASLFSKCARRQSRRLVSRTSGDNLDALSATSLTPLPRLAVVGTHDDDASITFAVTGGPVLRNNGGRHLLLSYNPQHTTVSEPRHSKRVRESLIVLRARNPQGGQHATATQNSPPPLTPLIPSSPSPSISGEPRHPGHRRDARRVLRRRPILPHVPPPPLRP